MSINPEIFWFALSIQQRQMKQPGCSKSFYSAPILFCTNLYSRFNNLQPELIVRQFRDSCVGWKRMIKKKKTLKPPPPHTVSPSHHPSICPGEIFSFLNHISSVLWEQACRHKQWRKYSCSYWEGQLSWTIMYPLFAVQHFFFLAEVLK